MAAAPLGEISRYNERDFQKRKEKRSLASGFCSWESYEVGFCSVNCPWTYSSGCRVAYLDLLMGY